MTRSATHPRSGSRLSASPAVRRAAGGIGFGVASFLFLWKGVDPVLVFHSLNPVFLTTGHFFREHLSYPGGLAEYGGAFLLQLHAVGWLGALSMTVLALLAGNCA